jgi:hypothetical protein
LRYIGPSQSFYCLVLYSEKRWAQQQQHFICHLVWLLLLFVTFIFPLFLSIHFHHSSCSLFMILFKSFHGSKTCNIKWTSLPPPPVFFFPFRIWHHRENTNVVCVCVYFLCAQAQDRFSLFHPPRWFQFYAHIHTSWKLFIHFYYFFFLFLLAVRSLNRNPIFLDWRPNTTQHIYIRHCPINLWIISASSPFHL